MAYWQEIFRVMPVVKFLITCLVSEINDKAKTLVICYTEYLKCPWRHGRVNSWRNNSQTCLLLKYLWICVYFRKFRVFKQICTNTVYICYSVTQCGVMCKGLITHLGKPLKVAICNTKMEANQIFLYILFVPPLNHL